MIFKDGPQLVYPTYTVTVNYGLSVEEMVAAGRYDWANGNITQQNFPHDLNAGIRKVVIHLVGYPDWVESEAVKQEFKARGLRPVSNAELLALGEQFPGLQLANGIVELGSLWRGPSGLEYVSVLEGFGASRSLYLAPYGYRWDQNVLFAGVAE